MHLQKKKKLALKKKNRVVKTGSDSKTISIPIMSKKKIIVSFIEFAYKNDLVIFVAQNKKSIFWKKKNFNENFFLQISSKDKAWNLMYLLHYVTCIVIPKNSRQWFSGRCWQSFHVIRSELLKIWNISDCGVRDFRKKSLKYQFATAAHLSTQL